MPDEHRAKEAAPEWWYSFPEHPMAYLGVVKLVSLFRQCDLVWEKNAVSVVAKFILFRQSRADAWFGSGEDFYSLGANSCS